MWELYDGSGPLLGWSCLIWMVFERSRPLLRTHHEASGSSSPGLLLGWLDGGRGMSMSIHSTSWTGLRGAAEAFVVVRLRTLLEMSLSWLARQLLHARRSLQRPGM